ncbi:MAG: hydrogenase maturation protease [Candidatus Hydrogenedentota bacterium]
MAKDHTPITLFGVGNALRGDDGIGLLLARSVGALSRRRFAVCECTGEPAALLEQWSGLDAAMLFDAVHSGGPPGAVFRVDVTETPLPDAFKQTSTHGFGVAEAVELSRALGVLPLRLLVYGVEAANFDHGAEMTPEVAAAIPEVVRMAARDAASWTGEQFPLDSETDTACTNTVWRNP